MMSINSGIECTTNILSTTTTTILLTIVENICDERALMMAEVNNAEENKTTSCIRTQKTGVLSAETERSICCPGPGGTLKSENVPLGFY